MAGEATCRECGTTLGVQRIARLDEEAEALCEDCATGPDDEG